MSGMSNGPTAAAACILVADDHAGLRRALRDTLEAEGYAVTEAADGAQALEALADGRIDVAMVDLRMPGVDGFGVLERAAECGLTAPVLVTSAVGDRHTRERSSELGAFAFHKKPFVLDQLLADLERAVARVRTA